ncbi:SanA/YdcF family protein [Streptomyces glaucosporus]|uniref:SanA/YdcF family protein n=1 Tax=Streptomyces glaucosporus TaxID=284044 RepID=UPI0031E2894B
MAGDNSRRDYGGTGAMRACPVRRGVPAGDAVGDHAGFDTWDSRSRARRIFGVERAPPVSRDFHVRRAPALCRAAGADAYGVGAGEPHGAIWCHGALREVASAVKAGPDAAFTPGPRFPGPRGRDPGRALADRARRAGPPIRWKRSAQYRGHSSGVSQPAFQTRRLTSHAGRALSPGADLAHRVASLPPPGATP